MGVAVGRAVRISGLIIVNYNSTAAHLKHPQVVYDFYSSASAAANADLSCGRKVRKTDAVSKQTGDQNPVMIALDRQITVLLQCRVRQVQAGSLRSMTHLPSYECFHCS